MKSQKQEKDISICPIFEKTGCCPHGDFCPLYHMISPLSRCLVFHHLYPNPLFFKSFFYQKENETSLNFDEKELQQSFDAFFMDVFLELSQFGKVDDLFVAGNLCPHLYGNVFVRFDECDDAMAAHIGLENRYYAGRKVHSSFVPLEILSSSICNEHNCIHQSNCNFVHMLVPSKHVQMQCFPRAMTSTPEPLRTFKQSKYLDSPYELPQGRTRLYKLIQ